MSSACDFCWFFMTRNDQGQYQCTNKLCEGYLGPGNLVEKPLRLSQDQVNEVMRLASVLATARVRGYAYAIGHAANETRQGITAKVKRSSDDLRNYLESLK